MRRACSFDVAKGPLSLREGYCAKKAETGTLPVHARDPTLLRPIHAINREPEAWATQNA